MNTINVTQNQNEWEKCVTVLQPASAGHFQGWVFHSAVEKPTVWYNTHQTQRAVENSFSTA